MITEALLAYAHILAILMMATFLASEAALCRKEWMNAAVIERLVLLDLLYGISVLAVLLTGLARTWWGLKGFGWYWAQPLLHAKVAMLGIILATSLVSTSRYRRWRRTLHATGALPMESAVRSTRRRVLVAAHLLAVVPLLGVLLVRGIGTR